MRLLIASSLALVVAAAACSSNDNANGPDGHGGAATGTGTGTEVGGGGADPSQVPAEQLPADPSVDCPATFQGMAPVAGQNAGFDSAGQSRGFYLQLPDPALEGPRPLFVGFHGTSETGVQFYDRGELSRFVERGFIVVAPDGNGNGTIWPIWDAMHTSDDPDANNPDMAYFDELVQCLAAHYPIDKNRLYIGGHSAGGIMTNYVLQRRSALLAGGIVGSGVFSLTEPKPPAPLEDTFALVTWGGENDTWGGSANGDVSVTEMNFHDQSALASQFYSDEANVGQVWCHANNEGHVWLSWVNDVLIDLLLAHPKGVSGKDGVQVEANPGGEVTCGADAFPYESSLTVICPTQTTKPGCEVACQLFGDCAVENGTVGPAIAGELTALGFSGPDNTECAGCVTNCEQNATTAADDEVLACITDFASTATCGPGIQGGLPAIDAVNVCCDGRTDSPLCMSTCGILWQNEAVKAFAPTCGELVGG